MYSPTIHAILICMVITGAARSVTMKLFYQLGFDYPLFVTLLFLLGKALSLVVYFMSNKAEKIKNITLAKASSTYMTRTGSSVGPIEKDLEEGSTKEGNHENVLEHKTIHGEAVNKTKQDRQMSYISEEIDREDMNENESEIHPNLDVSISKRRYLGSDTGLTEESKKAVSWVHRIPWYLKPVIPSLLDLINSAMMGLSLLYVAASVAEMLISGLELVFSVVVAKLVRKRKVSKMRWAGVVTVAVGTALIGATNLVSSKETKDGMKDQTVGILLIVAKCSFSVLQDISEELFMQEADFPATLLLGMEGLYGFAFGIMLYFPSAHILGENTKELGASLVDTKVAGYCVGLALLVTVASIFNILATGVTSSMTRNIWKNMRTILVWVMGLIMFYSSDEKNIGEEWKIPQSFYNLGGFAVMIIGIFMYYWRR